MKIRKNNQLLAFCLAVSMALSALLSGCAAGPPPAGGGSEDPVPPDVSTPQPGNGSVVEFRLGERTLSETPGEVPFPLDGLLGVPEGEGRPVVFLLHGAHGAQDVTQDRYYQGFHYLVQALADAGYLVVAMNTNRAFSVEPFEGSEYNRVLGIFQAYYAQLARANEGELIFSQDITGKADLNQLNFIGHSRGGDDGLYLAKQLADGGSGAVRSVLLVASPLMLVAEEGAVDVPTGIVLSQYDGDVTGLETATLWNRAWTQGEQRETPVSMAVLYGGNHNQYNEILPQADTLAPPQGVTYLSGVDQRTFLTRYAVDFLAAFNGGEGEVSDRLGPDAPQRYGVDFMPSLLMPGEVLDWAAAEADPGMELTPAVFSQVPERNTIAPFNHPGPIETDMTLYRMSWTGAGQRVTLHIPNHDWRGNGALTLWLANDPTSPGGSDALALDVVVTDTSGREAVVPIAAGETPALRHLPTPVVDLFVGMEGLPAYYMAQYHTPLGTHHIPLKALEGIDLASVDSVSLRGGSDTGALVLGGLRLTE